MSSPCKLDTIDWLTAFSVFTYLLMKNNIELLFSKYGATRLPLDSERRKTRATVTSCHWTFDCSPAPDYVQWSCVSECYARAAYSSPRLLFLLKTFQISPTHLVEISQSISFYAFFNWFCGCHCNIRPPIKSIPYSISHIFLSARLITRRSSHLLFYSPLSIAYTILFFHLLIWKQIHLRNYKLSPPSQCSATVGAKRLVQNLFLQPTFDAPDLQWKILSEMLNCRLRSEKVVSSSDFKLLI